MSGETTSMLGRELSTFEFWSQPASARAAVFAELRAHAPVTFQPPPDFGAVPAQQGYWAVTRHDDVVAVSRRPDVYCSGQGISFEDQPMEMLEMASSFIVMDAPRHTALRRVVSGAFTPRQIARLNAAIAARAEEIVVELVARGSGDAVTDLAMKLPLWTISEMMGVPQSMRADMYNQVQVLVESQLGDRHTGDPSGGPDASTAQFQAAMNLAGMAAEIATAKRARPTDDVMSALANAQLDGVPLSDSQLGGIFLLFAVAGNDTTRNSTTFGISAFSDNPRQWARLRDDVGGLVDRAVEEILRWASPVIQFRRTATRDVQLGGQTIGAGDHVVVFYESANRDEKLFVDPNRFDMTRDPNPHVAFGGGGPHFCLGANLARAQLRAVFGHLAVSAAELRTGEPSFIASNFVNGVRHLPIEVIPAQAFG
jgi:cytochrome P450